MNPSAPESSATPADVITTGDLCGITQLPAHVINYSLSKRTAPKPCARIGIIRVWSRSDLPAILALINSRRQRASTSAPALSEAQRG